MSNAYVGRHRGTAGASATERASAFVAPTAAALKRPVVASGVAVAVVAASAAGYAASGAHPGSAAMAFTVDDVSAAAAQHPADANDAVETVRQTAKQAQGSYALHIQLIAAQRKAAADKAAAEAKARKQAAEGAARSKARASLLAVSRSNPRDAARAMLAQYGWSVGQFGCLDSLWSKESGWKYQATNVSSGAYGIPQSLPGSKMASAGSDWRTNPITQIAWGLAYIRGSYGSPCGAWAHSQAVNWY